MYFLEQAYLPIYYQVSDLDLAILSDCGFNVDAPLGNLTVGITGSGRNAHLPVTQWFSAKDPDKEAITWYEVRNITANPDTGHFSVPSGYTFVNGKPVPVSGDRPAGEMTYITASDFPNVQFVTGNSPGSNELYFSAYDGHLWSPPVHFTYTTT
jgi:hypothetical protein